MTNLRSHVTLGLIAASLTACSAESSTSPVAQSDAAPPASAVPARRGDLSSVLLEMSSGGLGRFPGAAAVSLATSESGIAHTIVDPSHCSYDAQIQGFACPEFTIAGVTHTLSFWLYDALGVPQRTLDMHAVAAIRLVTDYSGTTVYSSGAVQEKLSGHTDLIMTGLGTSTPRITGASVANADLVAGDSPEHQLSQMHSTTNVTLSGDAGYPAGGSVAITYLDRGPTVIDGNSSITFGGGRYAKLSTTMTKNGQTGSSSCSIDLSTGIESC
jgi:hypothetical protein